MADFFRVQLGIVSRAEGHCALKRSAYQSCGVVLTADGERFDFRRKAAEHVQTLMLVPPEAPEWCREPQLLWQRAADAEKRVDAQEARILDFSMPRAIRRELWEQCVREVYEPFLRMGMVIQIDIHDSPASDGGRNVNVHGLATLRELDGDAFSRKKNRSWNDLFRERNGRRVREVFAGRLTDFCRRHGIDFEADARSNVERCRPLPEPELPRWNFEVVKRGEEASEAFAALMEHRSRRRAWERALAEEEQIEAEIRMLMKRRRAVEQCQIMDATPGRCRDDQRDRRAAILRAWHGSTWVDASHVSEITATRFDEKRNCLWIDLRNGSTLIDHGDRVTLRGPVTKAAVSETIAAALRHGWTKVEVHGDQDYKDAVTIAAILAGVRVTNHMLSPAAERALERLKAAQGDPSFSIRQDGSGSTRGYSFLSSQKLHEELTKARFVHHGQAGEASAAASQACNMSPRRPPLT
ncbi:MobA/MobL family protein [Neoaquamicrobium sediminum]|uniref:MobA/MobL family protein n=1 Tax=Neoaquamicrobium sediminum TaxID=1849104 RepID=UPI003BA99AA5